MTRLAPVISFAHGGGPLPVLGDPAHADIIRSLKTRVPKILKLGTPEEPRAIVLVTAHWSTDEVSISSGEKPESLDEFRGMPEVEGKMKHDAPGSPEVAELVRAALEKEGITARKNEGRGWDHGVFVPMMLIDPEANIPIVQVSVLTSDSISAHYAYGRAMSSLRSQNIAILGSGSATFHNVTLLFSGVTKSPAFQRLNADWSKCLSDAVETDSVEERGKKLEAWNQWPGVDEMHPKGGKEHFLPLVVCAGAGGGKGAKSYLDEFHGLQLLSYYWDE